MARTEEWRRWAGTIAQEPYYGGSQTAKDLMSRAGLRIATASAKGKIKDAGTGIFVTNLRRERATQTAGWFNERKQPETAVSVREVYSAQFDPGEAADDPKELTGRRGMKADYSGSEYKSAPRVQALRPQSTR
jgi:hypothetical protein